MISKDEECQKYFPEKASKLKPAFTKTGTITAFNSSKMNDGACTLVLMDEQVAKARGIQALARIIGYEDSAVQPIDFAIAPSSATNKLLKKIKMNIKDINCFEYNEAFSAVALANGKLLDLDMERVNIHGGAVALGHPLGASGARIILSLMNSLRVTNQTIGLAAICNGGGGASSIAIERLL
jgi:acetyl-CoA C-acetyltransferase